ncbi:PQQ-binding-like beta-propeller repeat protein [Candidatus Micrarchaeota archaeon]|nr:PQQ-binding-like beta-propeller repeat protein [Candidatus Micrarchaeota archaeon]
MKRAFLLLFLLSISSASLIWQFSTDGAITVKPVVYQGSIVVASDDGNIYALNPTGGTQKWHVNVGKTPNDLILFDNAIVASTSNGKLVKVGTNGVVLWSLDLNVTKYNVSQIYGASANTNQIFITTDNGVYIVGLDGTVNEKIATYSNAVLSPPVAGPDFVIYGNGSELLKVSKSGLVLWKAKINEGSFWLSRPVIDGNVVYIGSLDDRLHAFFTANGGEVWQTRTNNWIISTPLVKNGVVYVGSDDGGVYSIDGSTGSTNWIAQTQLAVQSQPEAGTMGGHPVIFVGGTDKSIYAISSDTGEIVWKGPSAAVAGSPAFYQNMVIVGAGDGKVYAYSTERACSITNPHEADIVGLKELEITGKYVSESGSANVLVQINSGEWTEANTSEVDWISYVDPKVNLTAGLNTIACKVVDSGGEESGTSFTTVAINHDPTIKLSDLAITVSPNPPMEGKNFTIFVNDQDGGAPVDRFNLIIDGRPVSGNRNVTVMVPQPGTSKIIVRKIGFNDANTTVNVNASGVNPIFLVLGVIVIIVVVSQLWSRVLSQKFTKRK